MVYVVVYLVVFWFLQGIITIHQKESHSTRRKNINISISCSYLTERRATPTLFIVLAVTPFCLSLSAPFLSCHKVPCVRMLFMATADFCTRRRREAACPTGGHAILSGCRSSRDAAGGIAVMPCTPLLRWCSWLFKRCGFFFLLSVFLFVFFLVL